MTVVNILIHLKERSFTPGGVNSRQCFSRSLRPWALMKGHHPSITSPWLYYTKRHRNRNYWTAPTWRIATKITTAKWVKFHSVCWFAFRWDKHCNKNMQKGRIHWEEENETQKDQDPGSGICYCIFFQASWIFLLQQLSIVHIVCRGPLDIHHVASASIMFMGRRTGTTGPPKVLTLSFPEIHGPFKTCWRVMNHEFELVHPTFLQLAS